MTLFDDATLARKVKAELRKRLRGLRNTTPAAACARRSAQIVARLLEEPAILAAPAVALFCPIEERHEVDLRPLDAALRARGVTVAYPAIDPDTRVMTFREAPLEALEERGLGFAEPAPEAPVVTPAVVVCPALALAPTGTRLGYGAGFYDRALAALPDAIPIGVAYDFQLLVELPSGPHDVPMHVVVTDARRLAIKAGS